MNAGYSKLPLLAKLGIREGMLIYFQNVSHDLKNKIALLPKGCVITKELSEPIDFMWWCPRDKADLESDFGKLRDALKKDGMLWVSWIKKTYSSSEANAESRSTTEGNSRQARIVSNLGENLIRDVGLKNGMVDVKVIAVNEEYSGLKFVFRVKDR